MSTDARRDPVPAGDHGLVESLRRFHRAQLVIGGGVSSGQRASMPPHPIYFERGRGSHLWDVDGNEYVDYVMGWGPLILGHSHPAVVGAVTAQMALGQTYGSGHHWEYEVAERVVAAVPGVDRLLWVSSGTEAVQLAVRLARAFTGKHKIVKFFGHYHGWGDEVLAGYRRGLGVTRRAETPGQRRQAQDQVILLAWNDIHAVSEALREAGHDVAAVIFEPVLCNSGVIAPIPGYLEALREVTRRSGCLLICDEVITGFRLARGGAVQRYGLEADLVTFGKVIGGGLPVSAVGGRADIIDEVTRGVVHAGTLNGNPVGLSAAAATLDILSAPGIYPSLEEKGQSLGAGLAATLARVGKLGAVNQVGSVVQVVLGVEHCGSLDDYIAADWASYDQVIIHLLQRGVFVLPGGRWYLSTSHTEDDIAHTLRQFEGALKALASA